MFRLLSGVSPDDLAKSPKLYITDTQNGAVEFKITSDDADVTDSTFASFNAGARGKYDSVHV